MKRAFCAFVAVLLITTIMGVTAFAHCGGRGRYYNQGVCYNAEHVVCPFEDCTEYGVHAHDGVYYRCVYYGTGHGCGLGRYW